MKKLLLLTGLFALGFACNLKATHVSGAEITYEYIGDSTGTPNHYMIYVNIYRDMSGNVQLGNSIDIRSNSSCFGNYNHTATRYSNPGDSVLSDGGVYLGNYGRCVDPSDPGFSKVSRHSYKVAVILPGKCSDFTFSWELCCRSNIVTNLVNASSNYLYLQASLNNTFTDNSSPQFKELGVRAVCVGQTVNWPQNASEPDGDSLYFQLAPALDRFATPIPWGLGYSNSEPVSTLSGVSFSPQNGDMVFTPSQIEVDVVKVRVSEYHYDSTLTSWLYTGSAERDMQLMVVGTCDSLANQVLLSAKDTASSSLTAKELPCGADTLRLQSSTKILCSSIDPTGTDFVLLSSKNNLVPIIAAGTDSCADGFTSSIWLALYDTISTNDSLMSLIPEITLSWRIIISTLLKWRSGRTPAIASASGIGTKPS